MLAVLTGEDWDNSGFGDLPVPSGPKRRDGSPLYKPRYRALARDRVRWVGDYVAFIVAETLNQAMDAAELVEVDYESLPAIGLQTAGPIDRLPIDPPHTSSFVEPKFSSNPSVRLPHAIGKGERLEHGVSIGWRGP